ncbi:hypothetical protein PYCC9005_002013 [Savitreella phatthalungensis]
MAGSLKTDPAIERWVEMRHNLHETFRWTGKSTRQVLIWGAIVPIGLFMLANATEGKFNLNAKRKDESIVVRK